jgi:glycosyltransferase involved in cell wall biosynthesis
MAGECLLSVIVPTYNYAHRLRRCLTSVFSQRLDECELIVVDDGSTDNTGEVLRELEHTYPTGWQWLRQDNAGAGAARNAGLRHCRGKYVLFLDADDELTPDTLSTVCGMLRLRPELGLLIGAHLACYPGGKERHHSPGSLRGTPKDKAEDYLIHKRVSIGHGSMVARRDLLAARPYPENFQKGEDIPVFAHLITNGEVACIDHVMARVNKHPTSRRHKAEEYEDYRGYVDEVFKSLPPECGSLKKRYAARRCLSLFRSAIGARQYRLARRYYAQAVRLDYGQALRFGYLSKALRIAFKQED